MDHHTLKLWKQHHLNNTHFTQKFKVQIIPEASYRKDINVITILSPLRYQYILVLQQGIFIASYVIKALQRTALKYVIHKISTFVQAAQFPGKGK